MFSFDAAAYSVGRRAGFVTVTHLADGNGTDQLYDIEVLRFADGDVIL